MASGLSQLLLCASTITLLSSILNQLCLPCAKLVVGLGKRVKKASSHRQTARVKQRKVRWSFPWQSLLLRSPDRLQWSACLNDQLICTEGQPTTIWQSSSIFFVPMFLSHLIRLRMRQSFISLLSHQRWIFFSNLYAAQPACLLSFAAFVAKRRDNRGWLPSKFPPLKLAF